MGLAMSSEGFEKLPGHFGSNAATAVFNLGDDFAPFSVKAQNDFAALRHRIGRIVDEIVKDARQAFWVQQQVHGGRLVYQFDGR